MAEFAVQLTDVGAALLARAQAGETLNFTSVRLGAGVPAGNDWTGFVALIDQQLDLDITRLLTDGVQAKVRFSYQNSALSTGFNWTETGLMAEDPDNPGSELLYAYAYAENPDFIPDSGTPYEIVYDFIAIVTNAQSVTATINNSLVFALDSDLQAHIGVGGDTQHPLATVAVAGFMSPADKTKLDAIEATPRYLREVVWSNKSTLADFNAATKYDFGDINSSRGEIAESSNLGNGCTTLYSMVVSSTIARTITLTILANDDNLYIYLNGVLQKSYGAGNSVRTWNIDLVQGNNVVQFMLNNSGGNETELYIPAWFVSGVTWVRAAQI